MQVASGRRVVAVRRAERERPRPRPAAVRWPLDVLRSQTGADPSVQVRSGARRSPHSQVPPPPPQHAVHAAQAARPQLQGSPAWIQLK